ncbi:MAG: Trk system potassium transporter TrkA [Verrucomicrobiota bacterium]|nr:Trk system potassium transporter TrkA [Verrucomicrobiota bacterium]
MKIVILGAGETGSYVASYLQEEHDVTLIDRDAKALEQVSREVDAATVLGSGTSWNFLDSLLDSKPDLFFAATGDDETNLIACSIAKNLGFPKTTARIKSREYLNCPRLDIPRLFYADHLIGAEMLSAQDLFKILIHSGDIAFEHFAHGSILMRTLQISEKWKRATIPLKDLSLPEGLIAGLIRRKTPDGDRILFPHGEDYILPGDELTVVGDTKIMLNLHELFHVPERRVKSVVLVGGSSIALHLAHFLLQQRVSVRIIEKNPIRCLALADQLPQATILNRDGKDPSLLSEEHIETADALVCCTGDDGVNFLICSLAKHLGCPKVVALTGDPAYVPLLEKAGVTPALSARLNIANRLLAILHENTILSVASLSNDAAKIVEIKVAGASKLLGIPLSKLSSQFPRDLLIAVIENHGRVLVGRGNSILCPDDTVIALCSPHRLEHLQHLFAT